MTATIGSDAYAQFLREWIERGFDPYLGTFMFKQLPGSSAAKQVQMNRIVEQIYRLYLTRIVRRPCARSARERLPIWITSPDLPVYKTKRQNLRDIALNDGLHTHGLLLEPHCRRDSACLAEFMWARRSLLRHHCPELDRIDVRAITHNLETVADYTFKALSRGRVDDDSVLILPQAVTEIKGSRRPIGRNSSIFGGAQETMVLPREGRTGHAQRPRGQHLHLQERE